MSDKKLTAYQHNDKRKNNPPVGLVTPETDCVEEKQKWRYDPHIDPALQFDSSRAELNAVSRLKPFLPVISWLWVCKHVVKSPSPAFSHVDMLSN